MMEHTPGPWKETGLSIVEDKPVYYLIAEVNRIDSGATRANAHLIAAAPDLLAACEALMKWIGPPPADRLSYDSKREDAWRMATNAIHRARGEDQNKYEDPSLTEYFGGFGVLDDADYSDID